MSIAKIIGYSLINTVGLLALTLLLQNQPYLYKDEELVISINKFVKNILLDLEEKPSGEDFLFINTAYDNQLVEKFDNSGLIPIGNETITDREKLSQLFEILELQTNYKYIICDVFFKTQTKYDSILEKSISKLPRIIIPQQLAENGSIDNPIFRGVQKGLVTIETLNDSFLKYSLTHDTLKSLPLVVYETLYNKQFKAGTLVGSIDNTWVVDYFIPEYRIRNYDLLIKKSYSLSSLGDLLILGSEGIGELVKNRLVVIGDFTEHDMVETPIGEISGPLLLTNVLLSMVYGDIVISWTFLLYISISYFLISLLVFYPDDIVEKVINRIKAAAQIKKFLIGISYLFFLTIISSVSYFIFHLFVNIFFLASYLFILDMVRNKILKFSNQSKRIKTETKK